MGQPCFLSDCLWTAEGRVLDDLQVSFELLEDGWSFSSSLKPLLGLPVTASVLLPWEQWGAREWKQSQVPLVWVWLCC